MQFCKRLGCTQGKRLTSICVALMVMGCGAASDERPSLSDLRGPFEQVLANEASPGLNCGVADRQRDVSRNFDCAESQEAEAQPYRVAIEGWGVDSYVGQLALRHEDGRHELLDYDSNPQGNPGELHARVERQRCSGFRFVRENPHIECLP